MLKNILKNKIHLRFAFNPYLRYKANNIGDMLGINEYGREIPIVVSLTSYDERFDDLELSLYSLLTQSVKPDKLILWLSDEYDLSTLPYTITKFIKNGLEIRFVKDVGSYTKIIYALKEFPQAIIVTADDDVIYSKTWLEKLYMSYIANPNDIQVHRAHRVLIKNGKIAPYKEWQKHIEEENARYDNFLTGVGGVLYPPNCFVKEVLREDIFLQNSSKADDIWLWIMALISGRKIRVVKNHINTLTCTNIFRQLISKKEKTLYSYNKNGGNDEQMQNLMKYYEQNVLNKLNS